MTNIKVLQVVGGFDIDYSGGVTNYVRELSKGLNNIGNIISITLDSKRDRGSTRFEIIPDKNKISIYNSPLNSFSLTNIILEVTNKETEEMFKEILRKINPDIVHFHLLLDFSMEFIKIAKDFGCKTIISIHDYWFICPKIQLINSQDGVCTVYEHGEHCFNCVRESYGKGETGLKKHIKKIAKNIISKNKKSHFLVRSQKAKEVLSQADLVIGVSNFVSELIRNFSKESNVKTIHIGTITAEDHFYNLEKNKDISKQVKFAFLGNFNSFKGAGVILEALEKIQNKGIKMSFSLYGRVSGEYRKVVMEHSIIKYQGEYNYSNLSVIMNEIDVLVVPPIWYDNAPQVVMEALAANVPVIGSRIGGIPDFVKHGVNGFLFEAGNSNELAEIIEYINMNPHILENLRVGKKYVKKLSYHIKEIADIYNSVLKGEKEYV